MPVTRHDTFWSRLEWRPVGRRSTVWNFVSGVPGDPSRRRGLRQIATGQHVLRRSSHRKWPALHLRLRNGRSSAWPPFNGPRAETDLGYLDVQPYALGSHPGLFLSLSRCLCPAITLRVYPGPQGRSGRSQRFLLSQMEFTLFPLELSQLGASITYRANACGGAQDIDGVKVSAQLLNHPATALGCGSDSDGHRCCHAIRTRQEHTGAEPDRRDGLRYSAGDRCLRLIARMRT